MKRERGLYADENERVTNWFMACNWGDVIGVDSQMPGASTGGWAAVCPLTGNEGVCVACKGVRQD